MSRKKREIQKRKKQLDPGSDDVLEPRTAETDSGLTVQDEDSWSEARKEGPIKQQGASRPAQKKASDPDHELVARVTWFSRNRENLLLSLLVLYVFFLGLGTAGELFEIEWILNLPLFK